MHLWPNWLSFFVFPNRLRCTETRMLRTALAALTLPLILLSAGNVAIRGFDPASQRQNISADEWQTGRHRTLPLGEALAESFPQQTVLHANANLRSDYE